MLLGLKLAYLEYLSENEPENFEIIFNENVK
jgi:hypothetical protein